jgi:tRNA(Arg) A34 adenosine deaminase TadA
MSAGEARSSLDERDARWLRVSFALAKAAAARGDEPYGAVLVGVDGCVLLEGDNTIVTAGDRTGHAEINLVRLAGRLDAAALAAATLYASTEPCAMCAGATYWAGIGRLVFGFSEASLRALTGAHPWNPTLALPCRELFSRGSRNIEIIGPYLEEEAAVPHQGFWDKGGKP